jgi:hypothetical protein
MSLASPAERLQHPPQNQKFDRAKEKKADGIELKAKPGFDIAHFPVVASEPAPLT